MQPSEADQEDSTEGNLFKIKFDCLSVWVYYVRGYPWIILENIPLYYNGISFRNNDHPVARGDLNFCRMTKINEQVIQRMT